MRSALLPTALQRLLKNNAPNPSRKPQWQPADTGPVNSAGLAEPVSTASFH
jgi:hypothetical protein